MALFQSFTQSKKIYLNGRGLSVRSTMGTPEVLVHGPYITVPKGRYAVRWQVNVNYGRFHSGLLIFSLA